jgi:hypothetical protein
MVIPAVAAISLLAHVPAAFGQSIVEMEPNDRPASATPASRGDTATGVVGGAQDSVDYWVLRAQVGDTIYAALSGCRNCIESGFQLDLRASDDSELPAHLTYDRSNPQLSYVVREAGFYLIRVSHWAQIAAPDRAPYTLTFLERKCQPDGNEPNDSFPSATPIALDSDVRGAWCPSGDRELFRIDAPKGTIVEFWMDSVIARFYEPPMMALFGADTSRLGRWEYYVSGTPPPAHHRYLAAAGGTLYLEPSTWMSGVGDGFTLHVRSYPPPPAGLSLDRAASELLNAGAVLTGDERAYLDRVGNKNGAYDLGDLQVFMEVVRPWR